MFARKLKLQHDLNTKLKHSWDINELLEKNINNKNYSCA